MAHANPHARRRLACGPARQRSLACGLARQSAAGELACSRGHTAGRNPSRRAAKLSDLPAELVYRIIDYILPRDVLGPEESEDRPNDRDDHHLLDHNGIGSIGPRPRPHLERLSRDPTPQALRRDFRAVAASRRSSYSESMFQWNVDDVVCQLFSQWDHLETVELSGLRGPLGPMIGTIKKRIPILNCAVRTMILHNPELDEQELSILLQIFGGSLRTLELNSPGHKINRAQKETALSFCDPDQFVSQPDEAFLPMDEVHVPRPAEGNPSAGLYTARREGFLPAV
ncbi:hypothetical protein PGT21_029487 [Puccinia graminis f. sp. tritici]|uniref:Uncharacterized protein n=1 Tax=Puccinia graminis f. sp. tritici TaxID=56615 RepID=A0A5B0M6L3_PUCGR|nr:hypothetical protein PGT21_029487 [Puccinia graminis f. sp. tritici]